MNFGVECECKNCQERTVGCHSGCKKYEDFLIRKEAYKKAYIEDVNNRMCASGGWCYDHRTPKSKKTID